MSRCMSATGCVKWMSESNDFLKAFKQLEKRELYKDHIEIGGKNPLHVCVIFYFSTISPICRRKKYPKPSANKSDEFAKSADWRLDARFATEIGQLFLSQIRNCFRSQFFAVCKTHSPGLSVFTLVYEIFIWSRLFNLCFILSEDGQGTVKSELTSKYNSYWSAGVFLGSPSVSVVKRRFFSRFVGPAILILFSAAFGKFSCPNLASWRT